MNKSDNKAKKFLEGVVVSDKMEKTAVVAVSAFKSHPKYLKKYLSTKKYKAHDPENKCKIGDEVKIVEVKPISKDKMWVIMH